MFVILAHEVLDASLLRVNIEINDAPLAIASNMQHCFLLRKQDSIKCDPPSIDWGSHDTCPLVRLRVFACKFWFLTFLGLFVG